MGAGILDRIVFPTEVKKGNPLSTRLDELAHFQVLKLGSSPNLYKLSHGDLLPWSRSFSQLLSGVRCSTQIQFWHYSRLRLLEALFISRTGEHRQVRILRKSRVSRRQRTK